MYILELNADEISVVGGGNDALALIFTVVGTSLAANAFCYFQTRSHNQHLLNPPKITSGNILRRGTFLWGVTLASYLVYGLAIQLVNTSWEYLGKTDAGK